MRKLVAICAATVATAMTTPALAAVTVVTNPAATATSCSSFTFSGATEVGCAGGYNSGPGQGNLLQGTLQSPGLSAIDALGYSGSGAYLGTVSISGNVLTFSNPLSGLTILGIHYGGAGDSGGEATSFFSFIAPAGTTSITVTGRTGANALGLSGAALFLTNGAVPEPATWAMMLLGFSAIGLVLRRRNSALPQLA